MQSLTDIVQAALEGHGLAPTGVCVAFSGGRDSTVLLHALCSLDLAEPLRAVHVDHGLQPQSADWAAHCAAVCRDWQVPLVIERVHVPRSGTGTGLEAAARDARYGALRNDLKAGEFLLSAHHSDDQLETVILRLMRGGGPAGVAGIRPFAPFGRGYLLRPLLQAGAGQIAQYAGDNELLWVEDPSNRDEGLDRNYVRHRVIPALRQRWPGAADTVTRTARLADEAALLLEDLAAIDADAVIADDSLDLRALKRLSARRQRNLVRWYLRHHDIPPPGEAALEAGLKQLLSARADAAPRLSWSTGELRRYRDRLYLLRCHPDAEPVPQPQEWDGQVPLELGALAGRLVMADRTDASQVSSRGSLSVRFRRGGERLLQHGQHVSLKTLFQEGGIVPWMRPHVPLVFAGETLLTVGGLWYADDLDRPGGKRCLDVCWTPGERLR